MITWLTPSTAQWPCVDASQWELGSWGLRGSFVSDIRSYTFVLVNFTLSSGLLSSRAVLWPRQQSPMQMLPFHPFSSLPRRLNEMTHSLRKSRRRLVWGLKRSCLAPAAKRGNLYCSYTKIVTLSSPASYFCLILNLFSVLKRSLVKDLLGGVHQSAADKFRKGPDSACALILRCKRSLEKKRKKDKLLLPCLPRAYRWISIFSG